MTTGIELRDAMRAVLTIPGAHYGADDCPHRCNPELPPHCEDCSGSLCAALRRTGNDWGCLGSFAMARRCFDHGQLVPFSIARFRAGALLFQGVNQGRGALDGSKDGVWHGHVGTPAGDGEHSLEARGHFAGIGLFRIDSLVWDACYIPPGITTADTASAPLPLPLALQEDTDVIAMPNTHMTIPGRQATARIIPAMNFVLLEDGARVEHDQPVAGKPTSRWWAPSSAQVPGWQIVGVVRLGPEPGFPNGSMVARYGYPDGTSGTYKAAIVTA